MGHTVKIGYRDATDQKYAALYSAREPSSYKALGWTCWTSNPPLTIQDWYERRLLWDILGAGAFPDGRWF